MKPAFFRHRIGWAFRLGWVVVLALPAFFSYAQPLDSLFLPRFEHRILSGKTDWESKRVAIQNALQVVWGEAPPPPPEVRPRLISTRTENGIRIEEIELRFGTKEKGRVRIEVIRSASIRSRLPVFLTQWNHRTWGLLAVQRGFAACLYTGADEADDSFCLDSLYPSYSFSRLRKRAWLASRVVDYLSTQAWVDPDRIALAGHSRNGKQSLLAAAFDPRISAVVSSSAGTGGELPWLYTHPFFANESIRKITGTFPQWFHPGLKAYQGKESDIPADQTLLMGLIAPRPLLISTAFAEAQACYPGAMHGAGILSRLYRWYGMPKAFGIWFREGEHGTDAGVVHTYLDWLSARWGLGKLELPEDPIRTFFHDSLPDLPDSLAWLGEEPPAVSNPRFKKIAHQAEKGHYMDGFLQPVLPRNPGMRRIRIGPYHEIGAYVDGLLFLPEVPNGTKPPVLLYIPSASFNTGYRREADSLVWHATRKGYAVLMYDEIASGSRIQEASRFYARFPRWTLLGKRVHDARAALQTLRQCEFVDTSRMMVVAAGTGALTALFAFPKVEYGIRELRLFDPLFSAFPTDPGPGEFLHRVSRLVRGAGLDREVLKKAVARNAHSLRVWQPGKVPENTNQPVFIQYGCDPEFSRSVRNVLENLP